jgi:hypothetical protein
MKQFVKMISFFVIFFSIFGCAYRYYLGFHGPSIKLHPDEHESVFQDKECLECHDPKNDPEGPPTPHPHFTGCLKCHNDETPPAKIGKASRLVFRLKHNSFQPSPY